MSLRILSGILDTNNNPSGQVYILYHNNQLDPETIEGDGVQLTKRSTVGARMSGITSFENDPAVTVSLRQLRVVETEWVRGSWHEGQEVEFFKIDTDIRPTALKIVLSASGGSIIEEISYMIIGDTVD